MKKAFIICSCVLMLLFGMVYGYTNIMSNLELHKINETEVDILDPFGHVWIYDVY